MDYFEYKDALAGYLLLICFIYYIFIFVKRYVFKDKSNQIFRVPISRNSVQNILLVILTYTITIPTITYYFSKGLRFIYLQFVDNNDRYLYRKGFFLDDYIETKILSICIFFYLFLIMKLLVSYISRYTIRKDNFLVIAFFTFMIFIGAWGNGNDIRTFSHEVLTELFLTILYLMVRNKVIKDLYTIELKST